LVARDDEDREVARALALHSRVLAHEDRGATRQRGEVLGVLELADRARVAARAAVEDRAGRVRRGAGLQQAGDEAGAGEKRAQGQVPPGGGTLARPRLRGSGQAVSSPVRIAVSGERPAKPVRSSSRSGTRWSSTGGGSLVLIRRRPMMPAVWPKE